MGTPEARTTAPLQAQPHQGPDDGIIPAEVQAVQSRLDAALDCFPALRQIGVRVAVVDGTLRSADGDPAWSDFNNGLIRVSMRAKNHEWWLRVEAFHAFIEYGILNFSDEDLLLFKDAEPRWRQEYHIDRFYPSASDETKYEASLAHAFAALPYGCQQNPFWRGLGNLLHGLGFRTAEEVLDGIDRAQYRPPVLPAAPTTRAAAQSTRMPIEEADHIVYEFGGFLAESLPIIKDVALLPYPKARIMEALERMEEHVSDVTQLRCGKRRTLAEIKKHIGALQTCRFNLSLFSEIDAEDREAVAHFNRFRSLADVPPEEQGVASHLAVKYEVRGIRSPHP